MASDLECEGEELNRLKEENEKLRSMTFSLVGLSPSGGQCLLPIWKGQVLSVSGGLWTVDFPLSSSCQTLLYILGRP